MLNDKICILIVDDEVKILRALGDYFRANRFEVLDACDGETAVSVFYENISAVDVIILDVMMPCLNGFDVLKVLRDDGQLVPIIMLTAKGEEYDQIKGLTFGADDYIPKPISPTLLLARTQAVLRRAGKIHTNDIVSEDIVLSQSNRSVTDCGRLIDLTKKEFDLLCYLMQNSKVTLSRDRILDYVWGYDYDGDARTVDTHIKQLRSKLESGERIKTVYKVGYKFE